MIIPLNTLQTLVSFTPSGNEGGVCHCEPNSAHYIPASPFMHVWKCYLSWKIIL